MQKTKNYFIFALLILSIVIIGLLPACGIKFNAVLYDDAGKWIKEEFKLNNLTCGASYGENQWYIADETYPKSRTFIVDDREKFEKIFVEGIEELEIDLEKEMLLVYTLTMHTHRKQYLTNVKLQDKTLTINFKQEEKFGIGDACEPFQRFFVVKLDKLDIDTANFEEI